MEIVYVFLGKLPSYTVGAIHQSRTWSDGKITLICDDMNSPYLPIIKQYNVNIVNVEPYKDHAFLGTVTQNQSKFCIAEKLGDRKLLFIKSFERFFILQQYMKLNNLENILFLELDLLIYFKPETLLPILSQKEATLAYVDRDMVCSAFFYVKSLPILKSITDYFLHFILYKEEDKFLAEMVALSEWIKTPENQDRVWMLPSIPKDERYNELTYREFDSFQKTAFDGMGIGISITGPDYTHRNEWIQKQKVWWGTNVKYNEIDYTWKTENALRVLYGKGVRDTQDYKVQCVHVHSKQLDFFLSKPMQFGYQESEYPHIHGDRFLKLAQIVLRKKTRDDYYEVKDWDKSNLVFFEDLPPYWFNPKLLFLNTEDVDELMNHLHKFQNPFILLTHNSDTNVTEKYVPLCEHPKLIRWYTQNLCIQHPRVRFLPIGFANPIWPHGNYEMLTQIRSTLGEKMIPFYANFLVETNRKAREECLEKIEEKGIYVFPRSPAPIYLDQLSKSIFCICPEGNGIDTHRFWESLYLLTVPIVLRNPLTENLSHDYPCILLDSWDELDTDIHGNTNMMNKLDWILKNQAFYSQKLSFFYFRDQIISTLLNS